MIQNKKYVWLKGCAGLGNRLYTVCSAIDYCNKTGRTLFVDWSDGQFAKKGINAFNEYFELKGVNHITGTDEISDLKKISVYPPVWKQYINDGIYDHFVVSQKRSIESIPGKFLPKGKSKMMKRYWQFANNTSSTKSEGSKGHFTGLLSSDNFPFGSDLSLRVKQDVVMFADFSPPYSEDVFLKNVRLKKNILDKVNAFSQARGLNKNTIGIHVRNTDKKPTQSIESLFKGIESVDLKNPQLFLATDNRFIIEKFEEKYPGVITYPKFLPENIKEGLHQFALYNNKEDIALQLFEDSIADMWLLSECQYLLYQGNSSFSIISKILHKDKNKQIDWLKFKN